jgi:hypothetical protein
LRSWAAIRFVFATRNIVTPLESGKIQGLLSRLDADLAILACDVFFTVIFVGAYRGRGA